MLVRCKAKRVGSPYLIDVYDLSACYWARIWLVYYSLDCLYPVRYQHSSDRVVITSQQFWMPATQLGASIDAEARAHPIYPRIIWGIADARLSAIWAHVNMHVFLSIQLQYKKRAIVSSIECIRGSNNATTAHRYSRHVGTRTQTGIYSAYIQDTMHAVTKWPMRPQKSQQLSCCKQLNLLINEIYSQTLKLFSRQRQHDSSEKNAFWDGCYLRLTSMRLKELACTTRGASPGTRRFSGRSPIRWW